ncbi:hypothetical protein A2U01_0081992, partial [Trifolium medium]|nr:hypothetical protein [Trifolium medium]
MFSVTGSSPRSSNTPLQNCSTSESFDLLQLSFRIVRSTSIQFNSHSESFNLDSVSLQSFVSGSLKLQFSFVHPSIQ